MQLISILIPTVNVNNLFELSFPIPILTHSYSNPFRLLISKHTVSAYTTK